MKIAMIGSGTAGSVFASYLRLGGADLWLVDPNKAHMDKVAADGMVFRTPDGEFHPTGFHTATSPDGLPVMDVVIIMVKTTITRIACESAKKLAGPDTVVATMQNGLGNEEVVKEFFPASRVMFGCGNMGTELPEPGVCVAKPSAGAENIYFGPCEMNERTREVGEYLEKCFAAGGAKPRFYEDVPNTAPDFMQSLVFVPMQHLGASKVMLGRSEAVPASASSDTAAPGRMAPPSRRLLSSMT